MLKLPPGLQLVPFDFSRSNYSKALKHCRFLLSTLKHNSPPKLFFKPQAADHCDDFNVCTAFGSQTMALFRLLVIAAWRHILKKDYFTSLLHCHAQTGFDECCGGKKKSFKWARRFHSLNCSISGSPDKTKGIRFSALPCLLPEVINQRLAQNAPANREWE